MKKRQWNDIYSLLKTDQEEPLDCYFIVLKENKKVVVTPNILYNTLDKDDYVYTLEDNDV